MISVVERWALPPKPVPTLLRFDVALYRDTPRISQNDYDAILDGAINYGLEGYEREDLVTLRNFLNSVLQGPDPAEEL
jgi:hypothetical protein